MDTPAPTSAPPAELVETARRLLSEALGGAVRLAAAAPLAGSDRSQVVRLTVVDGPALAPLSVIVKRAAVAAGANFDPAAAAFPAPAWRFFNEWAGLHFLGQVAADAPLAPRLLAGDRTVGVLVMEDLGDAGTPEQLLLADDADAASRALVASAALVGRMHARTAGHQAEFDHLRDRLAPRERDGDYSGYRWLAAALDKRTGDLALTPAPGTAADLDDLITTIRDPGPWSAYTHGDPCPGNVLRAGAELRLIDFEFGDFRHALTDGVYGRMLFPTCWCAGDLAPALRQQMEAAYRAQLMTGCPIARDDAAFARAVVAGCAYWALTLCEWNSVVDLSAQDRPWGRAGLRQRLVTRFDACARATEETGHYEALGATFRAMTSALRARWPAEAITLPAFPAFQPPP